LRKQLRKLLPHRAVVFFSVAPKFKNDFFLKKNGSRLGPGVVILSKSTSVTKEAYMPSVGFSNTMLDQQKDL
jgi:hypothetical protein